MANDKKSMLKKGFYLMKKKYLAILVAVDGLFKNGGTLLVPKAPREAAFFRPPAVAVHYYADMLRNINLSHQIDMISLSLSAPTASMVSIYLSVIF